MTHPFFLFFELFKFKNKLFQNLFSRFEPFGHVSWTGMAKQQCLIWQCYLATPPSLAWQDKTVTPAIWRVSIVLPCYTGCAWSKEPFRFWNKFWEGLLLKHKNKKFRKWKKKKKSTHPPVTKNSTIRREFATPAYVYIASILARLVDCAVCARVNSQKRELAACKSTASSWESGTGERKATKLSARRFDPSASNVEKSPIPNGWRCC